MCVFCKLVGEEMDKKNSWMKTWSEKGSIGEWERMRENENETRVSFFFYFGCFVIFYVTRNCATNYDDF